MDKPKYWLTRWLHKLGRNGIFWPDDEQKHTQNHRRVHTQRLGDLSSIIYHQLNIYSVNQYLYKSVICIVQSIFVLILFYTFQLHWVWELLPQFRCTCAMTNKDILFYSIILLNWYQFHIMHILCLYFEQSKN